MACRRFSTKLLFTSSKLISALFILSYLAGDASCGPTSATGCTVHRDQDNLPYASCKGLNLKSIPTSLPADITRLDLSYNQLNAVPDHSFALYPDLRVLDLRHNTIVNISRCAFEGLTQLEMLNLASNNLSLSEGNHSAKYPYRDSERCSAKESMKPVPNNRRRMVRSGGSVFLPLSRLRILDLSYNKLLTLSADTFTGLGSLQNLDLSANVLRDVGNGSFHGLHHLIYLNIRKNRLTTLSPAAFVGLSSLKELRLKDNDFDYDNDTFPPDVFEPVASSLTTLSLTASQEPGKPPLPDAALVTLVSLEHLMMDKLIQPNFGQSFLTMKSLTTLDFTDRCYIQHLGNESLVGLPNLITLRLDHCSRLYTLDACAFCPLEQLQVLSLRGASHLGVQKALGSVSGLVGRNISVLDFEDVARGNKKGLSGTVLRAEITEYLVQTCVSTLILARNDITAVALHSLTKTGSLFAQCIQHLDLSRNFIFSVSPMEMFLISATFKKLRSLEVQEQRACSFQMAMDHDRAAYAPIISKKTLKWVWLGLRTHIPPFFNLLNVSGTCGNVGAISRKITILSPNALKVIDFSYMYIMICETEFKGLEKLESLNISRSYCRNFSPAFFDSFPALRELSLQRINFDRQAFRKHAGRLFQNLTLLHRFDFSLNDLDFSLTELLHAQRDLRELLLAGNRYKRVPLELEQHGNLSVLDLSNNDISQLPLEDRQALDRFAASRREPFFLRLRGNPIACTCKALPFIRWLGQTRVRLDEGVNFPCMAENGSMRSTAEVLRNLDFEWRKCVGVNVLWGSVVVLLLLLALLGGVFAVSTNASRLRFFLSVFRRMKMPRREDFDKDAYVSYCDEDTEFVVLHLKRVLQDQRDVNLLIKDMPADETATRFYLLPGEDLAEKMLEHIDMCWKVLLVLSPALSRDPMAGLMTRGALQSISDKMAERVVLLCVGVQHMPALASLRALLQTVPERQVIFVPQGAGDGHPAWDALADVIMN